MKWPKNLFLIRHDISAYNVLKDKKDKSALYNDFLFSFERDSTSTKSIELAKEVEKRFALNVSDADTPLVDSLAFRAEEVGCSLRHKYKHIIPDVIFVSPYKRTKITLDGLIRGWPELQELVHRGKIIEDYRIREQDRGLAGLYNDWRVFHTLHPEQKLFYEKTGSYWYTYPQGENIPDVRERNRSWMNTIVRDYKEKNVLAVTHHLSILSVRTNLERWDADRFIDTDQKNKPINCGVTLYQGNPNEGSEGHFNLQYYNRRFYK